MHKKIEPSVKAFEIPAGSASVTLLRRFFSQNNKEIPPVYVLSVSGLSSEQARAMNHVAHGLRGSLTLGNTPQEPESDRIHFTLELEKADSMREYLDLLKNAGITFADLQQMKVQIQRIAQPAPHMDEPLPGGGIT